MAERDRIRELILAHLAKPMARAGLDPAEVDDTFDPVRRGVIDSFGFLELVMAVGQEAGIEIDFSEADPDDLTSLGGLLDNIAPAGSAGGADLETLSRAELVRVLQDLGLAPGDNVMVHGATQFLGLPEGGMEMYLEALRTVIGTGATVVVPTFTFAFARGEDFDRETTVTERMGAFAEHVRTRPEARRSPHPMQSVAALGPLADDLAGRDTAGAFDAGSPFERMLEKDFRLLLLGASVNSVSMIHYSEQHLGVPYRFWKDFTGRVKESGHWVERTYRLYARSMESTPYFDLQPVAERLSAEGRWAERPLHNGKVCLSSLADFHRAASALMAADPWCLVTNVAEVKRQLAAEGLA